MAGADRPPPNPAPTTPTTRRCPVSRDPRPAAVDRALRRPGLGAVGALLGAALLWLALALAPSPARAQGIELASMELARTEEGLLLGYTTRFELPRAVADAMQKGVPLYFVAEATVRRSRWYWTDKVVARQTRQWRLTWQPLTRRYRLNLGSVGQNYDSLDDALAALQRSGRWKLAEPADLADGGRMVLDFAFRLDTSQLPRPLQISFGGETDWTLAIERLVVVPELTAAAPPLLPAPLPAPPAPPAAASTAAR